MPLSAVTRRCAVAFSRGRPKGSPRPCARRAHLHHHDAVWVRQASKTRSVSSRSRSASVGQWVMHWPQRAQSESLDQAAAANAHAGVARAVGEVPDALGLDLLAHRMQRRQLMHLSLLRMSGKSWFRGWAADAWCRAGS